MIADEIIKNAERLLADGRRLKAAGSHQTAASLFVLAMEESGKACLVRWIALGYARDMVFDELRSGHIEKQHVYLTYLCVKAIKEVGEFGPRGENGKFALLHDGERDAFERVVTEKVEEFVSFRGTFIPLGLYDHIKQSGFYVDVASDGTLIDSAFKNVSVAEILERDAVTALGMAKEEDKTQEIVAELYFDKTFLRPPRGERKRALGSLIQKLSERKWGAKA